MYTYMTKPKTFVQGRAAGKTKYGMQRILINRLGHQILKGKEQPVNLSAMVIVYVKRLSTKKQMNNREPQN